MIVNGGPMTLSPNPMSVPLGQAEHHRVPQAVSAGGLLPKGTGTFLH